ncbi:NAD(P)-binding Rossmann-fold superfamily protein [Striga asiatica]|uniref:NAD(P)-binding Rossmann-fold superfamily protein n=1 Tax=Striga asiatica TaxID=4170 RepID=A0A5A7P876_STRAF|nr:NAD(P)-binding Rossmann-fold superfamily protein [Striga asiatica]
MLPFALTWDPSWPEAWAPVINHPGSLLSCRGATIYHGVSLCASPWVELMLRAALWTEQVLRDAPWVELVLRAVPWVELVLRAALWTEQVLRAAPWIALVKELIEEGVYRWNAALIKELFCEEDGAAILIIQSLDPTMKDR